MKQSGRLLGGELVRIVQVLNGVSDLRHVIDREGLVIYEPLVTFQAEFLKHSSGKLGIASNCKGELFGKLGYVEAGHGFDFSFEVGGAMGGDNLSAIEIGYDNMCESLQGLPFYAGRGAIDKEVNLAARKEEIMGYLNRTFIKNPDVLQGLPLGSAHRVNFSVYGKSF